MVEVLAVGAHPDDIELGVGGTVAELVRQGRSVALLDLTNGEPTPNGSVETRKSETGEATKLLNIDTRMMLDLKNRELMDTVEARVKVAEVYRKLRPKVLLLPYWEDAHPDHVQASRLAEAARFVAKYTKTEMEGDPFYPPSVFFYMCSHLKKQYSPTFIFDISDTIEQKLDAVRAYKSQFLTGDGARGEEFMERLKTLAAYYGSLIGARYGEPFISREELGIRSFDAFLP